MLVHHMHNLWGPSHVKSLGLEGAGFSTVHMRCWQIPQSFELHVLTTAALSFRQCVGCCQACSNIRKPSTQPRYLLVPRVSAALHDILACAKSLSITGPGCSGRPTTLRETESSNYPTQHSLCGLLPRSLSGIQALPMVKPVLCQ